MGSRAFQKYKTKSYLTWLDKIIYANLYTYNRAFQKKLKVLETQFSMVFLVGHAKRGLHPKFELIWLKTRLVQST